MVISTVKQVLSLCIIIILSMALFSDLKLAKSSSPEYTNLIYKGCSRQKLPDPYSQALSAMYGSLVTQSAKTRFYKTTTGASSQSSITGLFQCRGDLSNNDCYNCVRRLPVLSGKLCGKTIASRIQLSGCYLLYEVSSFAQISGMEMIFKTCGKNNAAGTGFEERRNTAFGVMQNGVVQGNGFFATTYESVYVLGQCEGDVGGSDCSGCIKNALQRAQVECGSSVSGQIYLHKCFIGYSYYPNGAPKRNNRENGGNNSRRNSWCWFPYHLFAFRQKLDEEEIRRLLKINRMKTTN
ncbi:PREDICTED: cysteine-rich repeat secretory protein 11-like isoform X2 [Camelina sativa]|uniref:Cysteine-rich repeat secretory protein 11-like isoform X2 n=1 Tax=Camelina sativa TaxID=90675 RepID=A0ABM1RQP4_CAMSA|nr:PREDICTED: cysteine-rich repeat secretory protein 11-like isoform X2 [Camelina sativa]